MIILHAVLSAKIVSRSLTWTLSTICQQTIVHQLKQLELKGDPKYGGRGTTWYLVVLLYEMNLVARITKFLGPSLTCTGT